jgi:hypothetical protein
MAGSPISFPRLTVATYGAAAARQADGSYLLPAAVPVTAATPLLVYVNGLRYTVNLDYKRDAANPRRIVPIPEAGWSNMATVIVDVPSISAPS